MRSLSDAPLHATRRNYDTQQSSPFGNTNLALAAAPANSLGVGVPDALAPFHCASPAERRRRVRDVLQWAWRIYAGGGFSVVDATREAAGGSAVAHFALVELRKTLLQIDIDAWEQHPHRIRGDVHRLFKRTISAVSPHRGGWRVSR
jgi:predicted GNAT superfamily acetyltransferase